MDAVASWTGSKADALRQALRMSNEAFADYLGVAVRTVAYWRKRPDVVPRPAMQEALDTALERASDRVKEQFHLLVGQRESVSDTASTPALWRPSLSDLDHQLSPDDESRLEEIERRPSRLDATAVESLAQVLASQRRLEDAIGAAAVLRPTAVQMDVITGILRDASGPHRDALAHLVAEWTSFVGWLHTAIRQDGQALALFQCAEDLADEVGNGVIASTATSFRGYVARLQGRPRSVIRASAAALATPGAHPTQQVFDMLQTAEGYADLGDKEQARRFLDQAADLAGSAGEPPSSVYWYTEPFFRLNIGLAQLAIGDYRDAAESLSSGMNEIPDEQRGAEWLHGYRQALAFARERS
jgi:tetratricopeptide (TPR) repeat protein